MVEKVPAIVPDKYAALAQEEKRFAHVSAPQLTHRMVTITDGGNSSTAVQSDVSTADFQYLTITNPDAASQYGGKVEVSTSYPQHGQPDHQEWCVTGICSFAYRPNNDRQVTIIGLPADKAAVLSLTGCSFGIEDSWGSCMTEPSYTTTSITERFAQSVPLTVNITPTGLAWDTRDADPDWVCPYASCTENLALGLTVTFMALPGGTTPTSWTGCDQPSGQSCTITMTGPRTVDAFLNYTLTTNVQAAGGSGGTVTDAGGQIDCGEVGSGVTPACSTNTEAGQTVVLTAHPDPQSTFSSWTGCPDAVGASCTVTMNRATAVTANFALIPPLAPGPPPGPTTYPLSVVVTNNPSAPMHTGYVTSSPAGINCGTIPTGTPTCDANFSAGTTVTLTATPNQGGFDRWTGCDTTMGYTCTVSMNQAKNVNAQFG